MYITYDDYLGFYEPIDEAQFRRLELEACRVIDRHTTGVDNVKKLRDYFPTNEADAEAVRLCISQIIHTLNKIQQASDTAVVTCGYEVTPDGMRGKIVTSISAGNESISYSTSSASATVFDTAAKDVTARNKLLADIVRENLSGVEDANGVRLLYMGRYPVRR